MLGKMVSRLGRKDQDPRQRVFCVSMQRTGTTSVGQFLEDFGYRRAGWSADHKNEWSRAWYEGDYESIFDSQDFKSANVFEDSPWFLPGFYKILFHRFPGSKFILFTRDPDAWFQSMVNHSNDNVLGKSRVHCKIYRREREFFELLKSGFLDEGSEGKFDKNKVLKLSPHAEHYKSIYHLHTLEVLDFFSRHAPGALHVDTLENPEKWQNLGRFLGLNVSPTYESHENSSSKGITK